MEIKHESVRLNVVGPNIRHYGSAPSGVLYTRADKAPKTAVIIMHPESDNRNDWRCIPLAKAGFAAFGLAPRYMKENQHLIMEETVLDVAEAIRFLKEERGMTPRGFTRPQRWRIHGRILSSPGQQEFLPTD